MRIVTYCKWKQPESKENITLYEIQKKKKEKNFKCGNRVTSEWQHSVGSKEYAEKNVQVKRYDNKHFEFSLSFWYGIG